MSDIIVQIKVGIAVLGGLLVTALGGWDISLQILVGLSFLDIFTGLVSGVVRQQLSSSASFRGLGKKVLIYCIVALGALLDNILNSSVILRTMIIMWYSINEAISIVENATEAGVPIPEVLTNTLEKVKKGQANDSNGTN